MQDRVDGAALHPQAREFLAALAAQKAPRWHEMSVEEARATFAGLRALFGEPPPIHHIEDLVIENRAPYPVERTLLTSGMTLAGVESIYHGYKPVATPEMKVAYQSTKESTFWRV